jgi:hypothetical protein
MPLVSLRLQGTIAVRAPAVPNQAVYSGSEFNADELKALSVQGIAFGAGNKPDSLTLEDGHVLFMPQADITVQTPEGTITIPKDAAVWIMKSQQDVAIYNFDQSLRGKAVTVLVNGKRFTLSPGVELLLTKNTATDFAALNPDGGRIGYRNIQSSDVGNGIKAYVAEFSIPNAFRNLEVIHKLLSSTDPRDQKISHSILKNAAILADLTGNNYK